MRERDLLIQLDAKPGLLWRNDEAIFPADRLLEDLPMETVPALDAFEDEEIRAASRKLNVGRADNRPAIEMGSDLRIVRFRHAGDFLCFQDAADAAQIHLQDRGRPQFEHAGEFIFAREALAGGRVAVVAEAMEALPIDLTVESDPSGEVAAPGSNRLLSCGVVVAGRKVVLNALGRNGLVDAEHGRTQLPVVFGLHP